MTIKELIKLLERAADGTPERYTIEVRDEDGAIYTIEDVEEDEGHIYIQVGS